MHTRKFRPAFGIVLRFEIHYRASLDRAAALVFLMTDGATEMTAAEDVQFGSNGVLEYVRAHQQDPARKSTEGIYRAARAFAGDSPQQNDGTNVVIKVS
jgi:serine phosphatase RsbU (regulator of sigma subunit)